MNEMFNMQSVKQLVEESITEALADEAPQMSIPMIESQLRRLQERQQELFRLAFDAGAECTDYDEEIQQVNLEKTRLLQQKAELEHFGATAQEFDQRLSQITEVLTEASGAITDFDDVSVRQLVSNIKVIDKERLMIRFKDGSEIEQTLP
ncbi:hypothetical protein D3Z48_20765 [Clostridiaceae bacterium]|nr:hypothetical protein [Clostridiaceae bacterium]